MHRIRSLFLLVPLLVVVFALTACGKYGHTTSVCTASNGVFKYRVEAYRIKSASDSTEAKIANDACAAAQAAMIGGQNESK